MASVTLPDGSVKEYPGSITIKKVAKSIGSRLAKDALWGEIDQQPLPLDYEIGEGDQVNLKIITRTDPASLATMRHSCAHVMARAVMRIKPGVQLAFGPTIDSGFYYDFEMEDPLTEEDFPAIEAEMKKIIELDEPFERVERPREDALQICRDMKQDFKVEHISEGLADHESLSFYQQGEFLDLCRGPHIPSPKSIGAFKLLTIAGASWKGDQSRQQLQRLYATAFFTEDQLAEHMELLEEAKKRDHRVLGKRLGLFFIDEMVGQGLILWAPKGAFVRQQLQDFISLHLRRQGYKQVFTPHIGKLDLYKTSGHFPYYQDSQYPPLIPREQLSHLAEEGCTCGELANLMKEGEIDGYLLKPMNCPHHIKIYQSQQHSYRDLPIRLAEFGTVYRWEQSGEIGGLTRVRGFTQDDAHLFVTQDQLADELAGCLELVKIIFGAMGMEDYRVRVGLRDPDSSKYVGEPDDWDLAEQACRDAAASLGKEFKEEPGEAAFYGPKIDVQLKDAIGREWQGATIQLDYQLPERFELEYTGADNKPHRPVMIHRAILGTLERFVGFLIEHFAGAFPLWLSPEQVRVIPISEDQAEAAHTISQRLKTSAVRSSVDDRSETLNYRVRDAELMKVPYMAVVGKREVEQGTVAVRVRGVGKKQTVMPVAEFEERVLGLIKERSLTLE